MFFVKRKVLYNKERTLSIIETFQHIIKTELCWIFHSPPSCSSAVAWNVSPSCRRTTHWYIPLSSRPTPVTSSVSPISPEFGSCLPSLYHVMCCIPTGCPLLLTTHRNSAVPAIWTLSTLGWTSTCSGEVTVSRSSALASPPAFDAEHL